MKIEWDGALAPILLLVSVFVSACASPNSGRQSDAPRPAQGPAILAQGSKDAISVGENLEIYVVEDETFTGRYTVRPSGHVIFPKIGRVALGGLTTAEAEGAIKRSLQATQLTSATVMVERGPAAQSVGANVVTVFVSGSVQGPGRRAIPFVAGRPPTVYQAILECGGFSRFAEQSKVSITRSGSSAPLRLDVAKVRRGETQDFSIQDGDMIFVPEKTFGW